MDRRPLKSRGTAWAQAIAKFLANTGLTPNQISILSIVFSAGSTLAFYYTNVSSSFFLLAALGIQLRLLCNLFDGMVAVEHGKKTSTGDIFNDAPDRIADVFIIMGLGLAYRENPYALDLAWSASVFAVMTAYVRVLGKSVGTQSYFIGPMAKQHRMFFITLSCLIALVLDLLSIQFPIGYYILFVIAIGSIATCLNRLFKIIADKEAVG